MSSRVLREGDGGIAAPIAWRQVDGTAEKPGPADARAPGLGQRLEQMESQHRQAIEQARAAAFREGESAGRNQAAAQVQPVIERLARSVEELALLRPRLRREAEHDMLRLALAVARRVLRRELAVDPDALHGLALAALEKVSNQQVHRVRVHPSMAPQMRALLEKSAAHAAVEVVPDASREPGTLIFETERGNLDASVESQLEEIERGLADRLQNQS
jgi:flagellar assembly protein FliH